MNAQMLEPCPFCGPGQSQVSLWFDDMSKRWRVGCGRCGCSTGTSPRDKTEAPAIKAWNTRPHCSADSAEEKMPVARPVAFRVPRVVNDRLSKTEFRLFDDEDEARRAACDIGADYDGLFLVSDRRAAFFAQPRPSTEPQTAPDLDQIALEAARKIEALNWNNPTQRTARIQCAVTEALRRSRCQAVSAPQPPAGYQKLPDGTRCRCPKMWQDGKGGHWCCLVSLSRPQCGGSE